MMPLLTTFGTTPSMSRAVAAATEVETLLPPGAPSSIAVILPAAPLISVEISEWWPARAVRGHPGRTIRVVESVLDVFVVGEGRNVGSVDVDPVGVGGNIVGAGWPVTVVPRQPGRCSQRTRSPAMRWQATTETAACLESQGPPRQHPKHPKGAAHAAERNARLAAPQGPSPPQPKCSRPLRKEHVSCATQP